MAREVAGSSPVIRPKFEVYTMRNKDDYCVQLTGHIADNIESHIRSEMRSGAFNDDVTKVNRIDFDHDPHPIEGIQLECGAWGEMRITVEFCMPKGKYLEKEPVDNDQPEGE